MTEAKLFREFVDNLVSKDEGDDLIGPVSNIMNFTELVNNVKILPRSSFDDKYLMATGMEQLSNGIAIQLSGLLIFIPRTLQADHRPQTKPA